MSTVTVVPTVEAGNTPPRVRLDVTDTGTSPALFAATVTRLNPDGTTSIVRTDDGNPLTLSTSGANRVGLVYDYEMPYGAAASYSTLESPGVVSADVTVGELRAWLIHPGVPELSQPILVSAIGPRTRRAQRGVHYPMGRRFPVVQTDGGRKAPEYTLSVLTSTDDEIDDIEALVDDAGVLLLNVPASKGWGVTAEYVSVGDITEARVTRYVGESMRVWELPCTVVDAPVGGSQALRAYVDLLDFSSYTEVLGAYPSYNALLAGP